MKIFLARHADAIDQLTETVKSDAMRYLTGKGREKENEVAEYLKEYFKDLEMIYTSPLIRAVQTAEIIAAKAGYTGNIELVNELKSETSFAGAIELIRNSGSLSSVLFVGHEPKLGILLNSLTGKILANSFSKSGVSLTEFEPDSDTFRFEWYFEPKKMIFIR
ncbi:MAG: phosphohistidine phosphatase SixA [Ignavibacteria bacterium]|nr:phosphohistidine phosphatase SixA [Ignavibacteria bacterium]